MDAGTIRIVTFALAALVVVGYVLFIRWRIRVHRAREAQELERRAPSSTPSADAILARHDQHAGTTAPEPVRPAPTAAPESVPESTRDAAVELPPRAPNGAALTVVEATAGLVVPDGLAPHPDATPHPGALDRIAFVGDAVPVDTLREQIDDALVALGYEVTWTGEEGIARRQPDEVRITLHPVAVTAMIDGRPAFPYAPESSVVVDLWIAG